jgi:ADP-ribosylglycohydrolase
MSTHVSALDRLRGCLLGGAVGDALGAPVEFMSLAQIRERFGAKGITAMAAGAWPRGAITDDTQMTLFTAEGLLRADIRGRLNGACDAAGCVAHAYSRWLHTQGEPVKTTVSARPGEGFQLDGWLIRVQQLFARRAPGNTCLSALRSERLGSVEQPLNDSKGCGGVMRAAPAGLMAGDWGDGGDSFPRGCEIAALTHGHPTGYLAAGFLALAIERLRAGDQLQAALDAATERLREERGHEEVSAAVAAARAQANEPPPSPEGLRRLGEGWVAEEALAIAVYGVCATRSFRDAVTTAVNHQSDSDSIGAIAGNLAGTLYGESALPEEWLEPVELRDVITEIADDLYRCSRDPCVRTPQNAKRRDQCLSRRAPRLRATGPMEVRAAET